MKRVNPDLPILDELAAEFEALIEAESGERRPGRAPRPRPPRRLGRRGAHRVARRAAIMVALLCLIGSVALAAHLGGGSEPNATQPHTIGTDPAGAWELSAYRHEGQLCLLLTAPAIDLANGCAPTPRATRLWAISVEGDRRYLIGLTGPTIDAVAVRIGSSRLRTPTRATDEDAAREAELPSGLRWFVLVAAIKPRQARAPAWLRGLDRSGTAVGAPFLDCSLGISNPPCLKKIRTKAALGAND